MSPIPMWPQPSVLYWLSVPCDEGDHSNCEVTGCPCWCHSREADA